MRSCFVINERRNRNGYVFHEFRITPEFPHHIFAEEHPEEKFPAPGIPFLIVKCFLFKRSFRAEEFYVFFFSMNQRKNPFAEKSEIAFELPNVDDSFFD